MEVDEPSLELLVVADDLFGQIGHLTLEDGADGRILVVSVDRQQVDRAAEVVSHLEACGSERGIGGARLIDEREEVLADSLVDVAVQAERHSLEGLDRCIDCGHWKSPSFVSFDADIVRDAGVRRSEKARNRMLRTPLVLDDELIRFLQGGSALIVCTLDPDGEPFASHTWGLTVISAEEPVRVRLLASPGVVPSERIAITGTDVPTLHSIQLKGSVVASEPANEADAVKSALLHRCVLQRCRSLRSCAPRSVEPHDSDGARDHRRGRRSGDQDARAWAGVLYRVTADGEIPLVGFHCASRAPFPPCSRRGPVQASRTSPTCRECATSTMTTSSCRTSSSPRRCATSPSIRARR